MLTGTIRNQITPRSAIATRSLRTTQARRISTRSCTPIRRSPGASITRTRPRTCNRSSKTKKTELLFFALFLRLLKPGGRAAVIVPEGVLFGSSVSARQVQRDGSSMGQPSDGWPRLTVGNAHPPRAPRRAAPDCVDSRQSGRVASQATRGSREARRDSPTALFASLQHRAFRGDL